MKPLFALILPCLVWGQQYSEVISSLDHSMTLKGAQQLEKAAMESYHAAEGKQLPTIDAGINAIRFVDIPTASFHMAPGVPSTIQVGTKNHAEGSLSLTYPLFTGFAVTSSIEKAKLEHEKATLEVENLRRNLYLNATRLYTSISAADEMIDANEEAKKAIGDSYNKAKGLYENGLLAPAELYAIEAKLHEIETRLIESQNRKHQALNQLSYLSELAITGAELPSSALSVPSRDEIIRSALSDREDLLGLAKSLNIAENDVTLAQSRFYPNLVLMGVLKRQGDTFALNGDGYTNPDKSYAGFAASWNLFNGMSDLHTTQAAEASKMASRIALEDYKRRIVTEIDNAFLELQALQSKVESSTMQVKAADEYAKLTRGRFDNQLAGADELSRSIADLAEAKAIKAYYEAELFNQSAAIWLQGGIKLYRDKVLNHPL